MLETVLVGTDTFNEGFTKFNNNSLEQFVNFQLINGSLICTRFDNSFISISLPLDASNKILTEVGNVAITNTIGGGVSTYAITPFVYQYNNLIYNVGSTPATNFNLNNIALDRIDIVFINATLNLVQKRSGVGSVSPIMPSLNADEILICAVYRPAFNQKTEILYSCFDSQMTQIFIDKGKTINNLSDLKDVNIITPLGDQVLSYDNINNIWINKTIQVGGNVDYIRSNPTNITVGGYDAGTLPNEADIRTTIDKILYKDYDPTINLNNLDPDYYEFGSFIPIHEFSFNINKTNSSATVSNRLVFHNSIEIANPSNNSDVLQITDLDWQGAFTINYYHSHLINFEVSYWNYATQYFSLLVDFIPPIFYGSIDNSLINGANILTLNKLVQLRGDKEFLYSPNEDRMVFCYPQSFGLLTDIRDVNYSVFNLFTRSNINIEQIDSTFLPYYIYKLNADSTYQNYKIKFIY